MARAGSYPEQPDIRFAIIADTHLTPVDGVSPSPWRSNALANGRTRWVVDKLNAMKPDFVVHLGDMIHPVPAQPEYLPTARHFHQIFADLNAPLHFVAGNHDVGDKPVEWSPAKIIDEPSLALYVENFGASHYSFDCGHDLLGIVLNSSVWNTGLDIEEEQWRWLEETLSANAGRRVFIFHHYPLYLSSPAEHEHYDNIAEPARSRLLALVERYRVEAFFSAHVHNFFYNRYQETEFYVAPSVSNLRLDYSEIFSVPPEEAYEYGRNDTGKVGFFMVDVFQDGHTVEYVRTCGETDPVSQYIPGWSQSRPLHVKRVPTAPVGVEMKHAWANRVDIPYSGVVDAFTRKTVKNDYQLPALWQMGLGHLRVPLEDLINESAREQMADLAAIGHRFTVFTYGLPGDDSLDTLRRHASLLNRIEIIMPMSYLHSAPEALGGLRSELDVPLYLSCLKSSADRIYGGEAVLTHTIEHGFHPSGANWTETLQLIERVRDQVDGLVFQTQPDELASDMVAEALDAARSLSLKAALTVRMGGPSPAKHFGSAIRTAHIVCDALMVAYGTGDDLDVILDTLVDVDRGYFPHTGLVDRRMNPTVVSRCFGNLHARLAATFPSPGGLEIDGTQSSRALKVSGQEAVALLYPAGRDLISARWPVGSLGRLDAGRIVDLKSDQEWEMASASCLETSPIPDEASAGIDEDLPVLLMLNSND